MKPAFERRTLPAPVAGYFANETVDSDALARWFTEGGVVLDERHEHRGRAAIAAWNVAANAKYRFETEILLAQSEGQCVAVRTKVSGTFPGGAIELLLRFTLEGERIGRLEILPYVTAAKTICYEGRGSYDVIEVVERRVRPPGTGEVRIAVKAAAVNPTDVLLRDPGYSTLPPPWIPGMDAAGFVESVGAGVSRLRVGDAVMAAVWTVRPDGGAQSALIVVPEASVVPIPDGVSLAEASTLPMNGLTALLALELSGLQKGQSLAVSGGAGLLAHYTIAIAKQQGLDVVADAKTSEVDLVRSYGADIVVERGEGFCASIREAYPEGVDALFDTALLLGRAFPAIRDGGVFLPGRGWDGTPTERGIRMRPVFVAEAIQRTEWLELLRGMVTSGRIKLRVTEEYAPERVGEAQRALLAGGLRGRPVIVF